MLSISVQNVADRPILDAIANNDFMLIGDASDGNTIKRVTLATLRDFVLAGLPIPVPPSIEPESVFGDDTVPSQLNQVTSGGYTLGMRFRALVDGIITHIRFYRSAGETGSQIGRIWGSGGEMLSSVEFGAGSDGWQQLELSTPLGIVSNTVYTVEVNMNTQYVQTDFPDSGEFTSRNLIAESRGVWGYESSFPDQTEGGVITYFRDVVFVAG